MTGKRTVKTNWDSSEENKDIINSNTNQAVMFKKSFAIFETTVECLTTQELKECIIKIENNDDDMFAFPNNRTEVFNAVSNFKNIKAVEIDAVSAKVLETWLPLIIFNFIELLKLFLSGSWFPKCLRDGKVYLLTKVRRHIESQQLWADLGITSY